MPVRAVTVSYPKFQKERGGRYIDTCTVETIYDRMVANHCRPVFLNTVLLVEC